MQTVTTKVDAECTITGVKLKAKVKGPSKAKGTTAAAKDKPVVPTTLGPKAVRVTKTLRT